MTLILSIPCFLTGGPLDGLKVTLHVTDGIPGEIELPVDDVGTVETYIRKTDGAGRQWRGSDGSWVYRHPSAPEGAE